MSDRDEVLAIIAALGNRDGEEFLRRYLEQEQSGLPAARLVHTAFVLAATRRWGERADLTAIAELVASAKAKHDATVFVYPLLAEGLLRSALGAHEMAAGIPEDHAFVWELVLLTALTSADDLAGLLDDAIETAETGGPVQSTR
jgi:hypothetical protein